MMLREGEEGRERERERERESKVLHVAGSKVTHSQG